MSKPSTKRKKTAKSPRKIVPQNPQDAPQAPAGEDIQDPGPRPPEVEASQEERIQACQNIIRAACQKYRCEIVPQIGDVEQQGSTNSKVVITATWALGAHP